MTSEGTLILAPNPSVLTGRGTNTYLCGQGDQLVCIDPGPDDRRHLESIVAAAAAMGGHISTIVLTHSHPDHRPLARQLSERSGAPIRCLDPGRSADGALPLADGQRLSAGELVLEAIHTPGHTGDHLCFFDAASSVLYSGDHILGGMTSVVAPPDGDMTAYMASLERIRRLRPRVILPGHGPRIADAAATIDEYITHRRDREAQVLAALRARRTAAAPVDLVADIYAHYPVELWPFAALTLQAHLDKLALEGTVVRRAPAGSEGGQPRYSVTAAQRPSIL